MVSRNIQNIYETAARLIRRGAVSNLKNLLDKVHASEVAMVIDRFETKHQDMILDILSDSERLQDVFAELGSGFLEEYLDRHKNYKFLADILQRLPSDDRVDLIGELPEEMSRELLSRMKTDASRETEDLLQYKEWTAGGLMSTEILKINEDMTVQEAIDALHKAKDAVTVFYLYVVDEFNNLTGVLSVRQLFQVKTITKINEIMFRDVVRVTVEEPQEEVARIVSQYDLVAIPVVDANNKLVGVITVDDVIDVIQEEAAEKVLRLSNASVDDIEDPSFLGSLKNRLPWFFILFVGGIFTCEVINYFYSHLPPIGIFAGFIPLMLRFSGIIARQSSTVMIQEMTSGDRDRPLLGDTFLQQGKLTLLIAFMSAVLVGLYSWLRFVDYPLLPLAVSVALFCAMLCGLVLGILIPFGFSRIRLDLAWTTGSIINFVLDVLGLVIYFKILILILSYS